MSKGSGQRPSQVPAKRFKEEWDRIFGKKKVHPTPDDVNFRNGGLLQ